MKRMVLVVILAMVCFGFLSSTLSSVAKADESCKNTPLYFGNVDGLTLLKVFETIKKCIEVDGEVTLYVSGVGGSASEAVMFYDLMRTSGAYKKTTFVAVGEIWSATNIVWLSASRRIVLPNSTFLWHKAKINLGNEDRSLIEGYNKQYQNVHNSLVMAATQNETTTLEWNNVVSGNKSGHVVTAQEALKMGWATEGMNYQ